MGKHLDYVQQSDGTYKWELAEIPAVKSTSTKQPNQKQKLKKFLRKNLQTFYLNNSWQSKKK